MTDGRRDLRPGVDLAWRRRDVMRLVISLPIGWPAVAVAKERVRIVGLLVGLPLTDVLADTKSPDASALGAASSRLPGFKRDLEDLGWIEGRNIRLEIRSTFGGAAARAVAVRQMVALNPDVILTGSTVDTAALLAVTRTIPIVFSAAADPVGSGFIDSLARPGGNATGFTNGDAAIGGKWLQFLKEANPRIARVGVLFNPTSAPRAGQYYLEPIEEAARSLGIAVSPLQVTDALQFDVAIGAYSGESVGALVVPPDSFAVVYRQAIVDAAARHAVAAIYPYRYFTDVGGFMSYSAVLEIRSASYVNLILRGAKPGDLPIQSPRKYELLINRKVADMLGLQLPLTLLARADEIIG